VPNQPLSEYPEMTLILPRSLLIGSALFAMLAAYPVSSDVNASVPQVVEPDKPLKLRGIMQNMGRNMQIIEDAISEEEWERVAETAVLIRDHPKPPMSEGFRIMAFAGSDIGRFRDFDKQNKKLANKLAQIAGRRPAEDVIPALVDLQKNCKRCHQTFRKPLQRHFYGEEWLSQRSLANE